ncbi:MAG: transposase [Kordiimonadaceae bacterium]|nr:transposase [Kordiimonadaceae bacterium]
MLVSYDNSCPNHTDIEFKQQGGGRRRRWSADTKLAIVVESFEAGETVARVARRRAVAPALLYR